MVGLIILGISTVFLLWLITIKRQLEHTQVSKLSVTNSRDHAFRSLLYYKAAALSLVNVSLILTFTIVIYLLSDYLTVWTALIVVVVAAYIAAIIAKRQLLKHIDERFVLMLLAVTKKLKHILVKLNSTISESSNVVQIPYDNRDFRQFIKSLDNSRNMISKRYIRMFEKEFELENKTVEDIMIPFDEVKVVDIEDYVGPILLDELHASKLQIFPVAQEGKLIGSVDLADLKEHESKAKIAKYMRRELNHIDDQVTIIELEEAFLEYRTQQFIVVNEKGDTRGVVSIYQLLQLHS